MSIPAIETGQRPLLGLMTDGYLGDIGIYNAPDNQELTEVLRNRFPEVTFTTLERKPGEKIETPRKTSIIFYERGLTGENVFIEQLLKAHTNSDTTIIISSGLDEYDQGLLEGLGIVVETLDEAIDILESKHYYLKTTD